MTITQTVEIPANHRLIIDVPSEVPAGRTILAFTPAPEKKATDQGPDTALKSADEEATAHVDALLGILSQIGDNIDIDELRTERIMAKHFKHLK